MYTKKREVRGRLLHEKEKKKLSLIHPLLMCPLNWTLEEKSNICTYRERGRLKGMIIVQGSNTLPAELGAL